MNGMIPRWKPMRVLLLMVVGTCIAGMPLEGAAPQPPSVSQRLETLQQKVDSLESLVNSILEESPNHLSKLDCDTHKFAELAPLGSNLILLASCDNVEPYLEGHRVTLSVGNPYAVDLGDVAGSLLYGETLLDAFKKGQSVDVSLVEVLRSGSWTRFQVIVNPSKPSQLRSVALRLTFKTVSLRKP